MLETSIFSFSHNVFNPMKDKFCFAFQYNLSSTNTFKLHRTKLSSSGAGLKVYPMAATYNIFAYNVYTHQNTQNLKPDLGSTLSCRVISLNPFPNKPWFLLVSNTSPLKTLREKEKLLVTSNFSFFPYCFLPFWKTFSHSHQNKIVVCKLFQ